MIRDCPLDNVSWVHVYDDCARFISLNRRLICWRILQKDRVSFLYSKGWETTSKMSFDWMEMMVMVIVDQCGRVFEFWSRMLRTRCQACRGFVCTISFVRKDFDAVRCFRAYLKASSGLVHFQEGSWVNSWLLLNLSSYFSSIIVKIILIECFLGPRMGNQMVDVLNLKMNAGNPKAVNQRVSFGKDLIFQ